MINHTFLLFTPEIHIIEYVSMKTGFRREKRIPAKHLPRELSEFFVTPFNGPVAQVQAVDASYSGFGFTTTEESKNLQEGSHVNLYPYGVAQYIRGRVIFKRKDGKTTRVGVQLMPSAGYQTYKKNLKKIQNIGNDE